MKTSIAYHDSCICEFLSMYRWFPLSGLVLHVTGKGKKFLIIYVGVLIVIFKYI